MQFTTIDWQSERYFQALELRDELLRRPLGLSIEDEDLSNESEYHHFGMMDQDDLVACVTVIPLGSNAVKIKQMAVSTSYQRKGVGTEMLRQVIQWLAACGTIKVELHARLPAVSFYQALGFESVGDEFTEVGIRHVKMVNCLSLND